VIENVLDEGLPLAYTPELYQQKVGVLFEHVYESHQGEGRSIYYPVA
jgi:type I restriction enzyme R subunit